MGLYGQLFGAKGKTITIEANGLQVVAYIQTNYYEIKEIRNLETNRKLSAQKWMTVADEIVSDYFLMIEMQEIAIKEAKEVSIANVDHDLKNDIVALLSGTKTLEELTETTVETASTTETTVEAPVSSTVDYKGQTIQFNEFYCHACVTTVEVDTRAPHKYCPMCGDVLEVEEPIQESVEESWDCQECGFTNWETPHANSTCGDHTCGEFKEATDKRYSKPVDVLESSLDELKRNEIFRIEGLK